MSPQHKQLGVTSFQTVILSLHWECTQIADQSTTIRTWKMASISSLLYLKLLIRGVSGIPMNVSLWMSASWIGNCSIFGRVTTCSWLHEKPTILQAKPLSASRSWETAIASAGKSHENPRLQWLWRKQTLLDLHELGCFSSTTRPDMHDTWKNGRKWRKKNIYNIYIYTLYIQISNTHEYSISGPNLNKSASTL